MILKLLKLLYLKNRLKKGGIDKKKIGNIGEDFASTFLELKGYRILKRNVFVKGGEVDILAKKGRNLYLFEVKYRRGDKFGDAFDSIDKRKREKLYNISNLFDTHLYENIEIKLFYINIDEKGKLTYGIIDI